MQMQNKQKNQTSLIKDANKIKGRQKESKNMNHLFDSSFNLFMYLDHAISLILFRYLFSIDSDFLLKHLQL